MKRSAKKKTVRKAVAVKPIAPKLPTEKTYASEDSKDHIMLFYGPPGVGKTTFVNEMQPRVLFLTTDRGTINQFALRWVCKGFEDFKAALELLLKPNAAAIYDMVCIDHIDDFFSMAEMYVCDTLNITSLGDASHGKGWKRYKDEVKAIMVGLISLDLGLVFIAHEQIKTIRTRAIDTERTKPEKGKIRCNLVIPIAGIVRYCSVQLMKKGGKAVNTHVLEIYPREDLYVKDRTRRKKPTRGSFELLDGKQFTESWKELHDARRNGSTHEEKSVKKKAKQKSTRGRSKHFPGA